nr:unnamed protein product [Callosobruchus analis]
MVVAGRQIRADNKFLHLYHLQNRSHFNITGQLDIVTTGEGEKYVLTAVHSNRTVRIQTGYSILDHGDGNKEYQQQSRLDLSPKHWIEYDVSLINKTKKLGVLFRCRKLYTLEQLLLLYKAQIRPSLEYCSHKKKYTY